MSQFGYLQADPATFTKDWADITVSPSVVPKIEVASAAYCERLKLSRRMVHRSLLGNSSS